MREIVIISTYPEQGSRNIGDQLITDSLVDIIKEYCDARITIVWRADEWVSVSEAILNADHVFFACLAIRRNMERNVYPWIDKILNSGVPFSVISAGTDLPVHQSGSLYSEFSEKTCHILKCINDKAAVFSTRGSLSQQFCKVKGLNRAEFCGDVAFYGKRFEDRSFIPGRQINKILVSDPHRAASYLPSLEYLYRGLSDLFPAAEITIAQHGVSSAIENFCKSNGIDFLKVYEDRYEGLNVYEDVDLHVGFRVHGHVSALKRRKYSYLLEQDGRGCDYGLTFDRKISVPNYCYPVPELSLINALRFVIGRPLASQWVSTSAAEQMVGLLTKDSREGFKKFQGLEVQIADFNERTMHIVKKALSLA